MRDRPYSDPVDEYPPGYGEGASDILIDAISAAHERFGSPDIRPALIHRQFLREDQVDSYI